jgi:hypothetical protein
MLCLLAALKQENRKQNPKNCIHCRDKHNVSERETLSTRAEYNLSEAKKKPRLIRKKCEGDEHSL